jgi:phosphoglycerate dehydrogenase-like enzyme
MILLIMNILFLNKFNDYWKEKFLALKKEFSGVNFIATFDPRQRPIELKKADAVITGRLLREEIENSPNLKVIFVPFTGLNAFPLELIKSNGIMLSNTHANARYVAEHAVALAFGLLGRIAEFHNDLKRGYWHRSIENEDMWNTIQGKTTGIIGFGNIGSYIARFLKPFGCRIIGFKKSIPHGKPEYVDELSANLEYTINKSHVVFVSLPLNSGTKDILNADILKSMKGKYLINVGRGDTVNEEGLYNALKDGTLAGAALDVWYNYPGKKEEPVFPANHPFWELPNVLLSPHKSSHTIEAINAMIDDTYENIRSYILTGKLGNTVKLD